MRLKWVRWAALFVALVAAAAWQSGRLAAARRGAVPGAYAGQEGAPPGLTFVMAGLGGFRGIAAEVLWFRVAQLQEQGRFLELVQLANWLTMMDPRASEAWVYNAWNMAYNVSVMMARPEDRLRWVRNGISLLRDEGLRLNPRDARLYRELAWFYQNKVGAAYDEAHLLYKFYLLREMAPLTGPEGQLSVTDENRARLAELRLDADRMLALERKYGAFDWRVPESHAFYWAEQGLECAEGGEVAYCGRGAYQALMLSVFHGRFVGVAEKGEWKVAPNLGLAEAAEDFMGAYCDRHPSRQQLEVYVRFVTETIKMVHGCGDEAMTERLYEKLKARLAAGGVEDVPPLESLLKAREEKNKVGGVSK